MELTTKIFGHRGASAAFPENTRSAFEGAVAQGADGVELDVRRTGDGVLVVHHDPELPDGRIIIDHDHGDLGPELLTLAEALKACEPIEVNVEIKSDAVEPDYDPTYAIVPEVIEVLRREPVERFEVSSFDRDLLLAVRKADPEMPTAQLLVNGLSRKAWQRAADDGHAAINPHWRTVDKALVERCRELGLGVNVWTCDKPSAIRKLAGWGVTSIIANDPAAARQAMNEA